MPDVHCPACGEPWDLAEPDTEPCVYCDGTGAVGPRGARQCNRCRGRGTEFPTLAARVAHTGRCPACPPRGPSILGPYMRPAA